MFVLGNKKVVYIVVAVLIFAVVFIFFKRKKATANASGNNKSVKSPNVLTVVDLKGKPSNDSDLLNNSKISVDSAVFRDKGYSGYTLDEIKAKAKAMLIAEGKANADGELIDENGYVLV